jgi:L-ascorbate metabolism protein UlaG (beta-lactamase superfamily)
MHATNDIPGSSPDDGSVLFIGTATALLRLGGFTVLTDPNFLHRGEHVRLGYGLRSKRLTEPALGIAELPPLDLVVVSHLHEDHFDRVAEQRLDKSVRIATNRQAAVTLRKMGFGQVRGLRTWESGAILKGDRMLRVTSMPGRHAPLGVLQPALPTVMGSLLELGSADGAVLYRAYISGDTLVHDDLREIPRRYPDIDLGLFHLGGTRIFGLMLTMDGKQGVEAIRIIGPETAIPIHYDDYDVFKSPLDDFRLEARAAGLEGTVRYLRHGESHRFAVGAGRLAAAASGRQRGS